MRSLVFAALAGVLALGACQSVQHNTASGRPEVTVKASPDVVKNGFVNAFINRGYTVMEDTPYRLVLDRPSQNAMANVLLGSQWNPQIHARLALTVAGSPTETRVVADMNAVTNPGTAFERLTPMGGSKDSLVIQAMLDSVRDQLEGRTPVAVAAPPPPKAAVQPLGRPG